MNYKTKQEMNKLSKECFGTSSRWQKIMDKGVAEEFTKSRETLIPTRKGVEKKVFTDKKHVIKHYSLEEVKTLMKEILEKRNNPQKTSDGE